MNAGDKATIPFGKGTMEGTVVRVCEKSVWLRVDFPKHPGKLIHRKMNELESVAAKTTKKRKKATK